MHQFRRRLGVGDRRVVAPDRYGERAFEVGGDIAFGQPGGHGKAHHLAADLFDPVCRFVHAACLHLLDADEDIARCDGRHWGCAEVREDVFSKPANDFYPSCRGPVCGGLLQSQTCNQLKGLGGREDLLLALLAFGLRRVDAVRHQPPGIGAALARLGQCDVGIDAQGEGFSFSQMALIEAPVFAGRRDQQIHSLAVGVLVACGLADLALRTKVSVSATAMLPYR